MSRGESARFITSKEEGHDSHVLFKSKNDIT